MTPCSNAKCLEQNTGCLEYTMNSSRTKNPAETAIAVLTSLGFEETLITKAVRVLSAEDNRHPDPDESPQRVPDERLLSIRELQTRLGVSATTLWRMKDLPYMKVAGRKRFVWSEVCEFLKRESGKGGAA